MAEEIAHGPNLLHPETPSAVGSRNSLNRHNRDEYAEARLLVDEEVDKILNHIHAKLPPEVAMRMEVMAGLKSKLHSYFNQSLQNMSNRYLTTVEDELGKKLRDLVDVEENRSLNRYTPRPISYLLDKVGGADNFHTGEVERSIINMLGHLHGHVQREMTDLETFTNSLLRRKTDVGAFVRGENAYAIVKCSFRDNREKPENVVDIKLSLNIMDSELISPIFPYQETITYLIKDMLSKRISDALEREVSVIDERLIDEGKQELTPEEHIFEKVKALDHHVSDEEAEGSRRYNILPKKFFDAIEGLHAEISSTEFDSLGVRENVFKIIEDENIRDRGYNTAVNSITHVLDWSRMGYQYIENYKTLRKTVIREYEDTTLSALPDERFQIELTYYDAKQIRAMREAFMQQLEEFERTIWEAWDVVEKIYEEGRDSAGWDDWQSFSQRILDKDKDHGSWFSRWMQDSEEQEDIEPDGQKHWNEITFIAPEESANIEEHPTLEGRLDDLKLRFSKMRERLDRVFGDSNPELREVTDSRLDFLESEFIRFASQISPFHLQTGVLLDVDIISIKRKSTTMMKMANVLNEFLYSISRGFADSAFASFSRRRSTQREDIDGEYATGGAMADLTSEEGEEVFE
ncbi:MAG: cytoplasmic filament protein CfpA [SAR324 cluster bacterium]|nr:cytoplasmic filament protein CfpA [SAR324 cluster bacterium]